MPIYKIEVTATGQNDTAKVKAKETRLIRANNQARALSHVVKDSIVVEPCSVDDAVALGAAGVQVEDADAVPA